MNDPRFSAEKWEKLTVQERVALCYVMAREAGELAQQASPSMRKQYASLQQEWMKLATAISIEGDR